MRFKSGGDTIDCRKSEIELGSLHEQSALPYDRGPVGGGSGKSLKKIFLPFIQRNPLKRLDPDERIQGNPR
jgi:hypothetical protein